MPIQFYRPYSELMDSPPHHPIAPYAMITAILK